MKLIDVGGRVTPGDGVNVILMPNTKRLKQLIKQYGELWYSDNIPRKMQCFDGALGVSVWVTDEDGVILHQRNVRLDDMGEI